MHLVYSRDVSRLRVLSMKIKALIFSTIGLLTIATNISAQGFGSQACLDLEAKFTKYPLQKITKTTLEELRNKKSQLFVIGESHYDNFFWKMNQVYDFFKKNINSDIDCLFSEISQDAMESEIQDVLDGIMNDVFYSRYRLAFGPLYQHVYDQGDKVVLVDAPRGEISFGEEDDASTWLTRRDSFMITRIESSLQSGQCTSGIYNIGYQHIRDRLFSFVDDSGNPVVLPYDSFGQRIKNTDVDATVIDRGILPDEFKECLWSRGIQSFIAPVNAPVIKEIFPVVEEDETSGDYILFLNDVESMNVLLQ